MSFIEFKRRWRREVENAALVYGALLIIVVLGLIAVFAADAMFRGH